MRLVRQFCVAVVLCAVPLLGACGGASSQVLEETALNPSQPVPRGIVVLPMALAVPGGNALEAVARSHDIAALLLRRTDLPVLGPMDFLLQKNPEEASVVATDTDLLMRDETRRVDVHGWIDVHVLVTENRAMNTRDIVDEKQKDPKKKLYRQAAFDSRVRVEATVHDAMRSRQLARVVVEAADDPTNFESGGDPRPGITRLIELALNRLIDGGAAVLTGHGNRKTRGEGFADSLPAMLAWGAPDVPSFDSQQADQPEMIREAKALELWDRFAPNLGVREVRAATMHPGVLVRTARAPLQVGDVVLEVAGHPVRARYQVDRLLQGCAEAGCKVSVWRGTQQQDLQVAWPKAAQATP